VRRHAQAGITLATAIMYLRILAITAVFNMELARRLDGVVINADSMQVYRELRILTARPTAGHLRARGVASGGIAK